MQNSLSAGSALALLGFAVLMASCNLWVDEDTSPEEPESLKAPEIYARWAIPKPAAVIRWRPMPEATGYTVYRSDAKDGPYIQTGTVEKTGYSYIDTNLALNTTYWYKASAWNKTREGPLSAAVSVTTPVTGTITAMAHNSWTDGEISAAGEVDWYTFNADAGAIYQVQWNDSYSGPGDKTGDVMVTAYQDSDGDELFRLDSGYYSPDFEFITVSSSDVIYLRVAGYDREITGAYALRYYDREALPPQTVPWNVTVRGNPKPASIIRWGSEFWVTGHTVYRSDSEDGPYIPIGTVAKKPSPFDYSYIDTGVNATTTYWYRVSEATKAGEGPLSAAVSFTTLAAGIGTALTHNTWMDGEISVPGEVDWYTFVAEAGVTCYVQWNERSSSPGDKTAWIQVLAYRSGDGTPVFVDGIDGFRSPKSFSVDSEEIIYVEVTCSGSDTGTYALRYY